MNLSNINSSLEYIEDEQNLEHFEDEDLIKLIQEEGNKEAKEIIFLRYEHYPAYVAKTSRLTFNQNEYADMMQYGNIFISTAINKFDATRKCKFRSFLYVVIQKSYFSLIFNKKKYRTKEVAITDIVEDSDCSTVDIIRKSSPDSPYDGMDLEEILEVMKKNLTPVEYNCVLGRYYEMSYSDIAAMEGINTKQVDNTMQNIRKNKMQRN